MNDQVAKQKKMDEDFIKAAEVKNQLKTFTSYTIIAVTYCLFFSYLFYFQLHNPFLGILHALTFIIILVNQFVLIRTKNFKVANSVVLSVGTIIVTSLFVSGGWGDAGFIWVFGFIPYIFFLAKENARFWIFVLLAGLVFSLVLHAFGVIHLPYSEFLLINYFMCLVVVVLCMFLSQVSKDTSERLLKEKVKEISVINQRLDQEMSSHNASEESLKKQTAELESAKVAMLNVMEDMQSDKAKIDEQKSVLDSVVHNMPIGVALSEPNGKPILMNDVGIALLGRGMDPNVTDENASEIFGLFRTDGSPYPMTELPTVLAAREGRPVTKDDVVIHRSDGRKVAMRGTSAPVKNAQGEIVSIVTVFEDITKERDVDRMKTEFISLASHQLRTPLSAIKWFSEMLVGGDAGELNVEQKDFAQNISASAERMIELVNSLLNISRIESGRILVDPKPTDLKELVQGVVTDLKAKIVERNQNLVISVREDMPKINLDPHLIRQVFMNLLTNAIKYTPKGGDITVFVSRKDDQVIAQVTDNGYGIPKAQQGKMFQKFFRAENIVKVETDGTGLGLYLIKAIIESSKGKIWFESEEGKGTTFWFSLPMSGMEAKKGEVTLDGI